jgi:Rad3-related DNA helicase
LELNLQIYVPFVTNKNRQLIIFSGTVKNFDYVNKLCERIRIEALFTMSLDICGEYRKTQRKTLVASETTTHQTNSTHICPEQ